MRIPTEEFSLSGFALAKMPWSFLFLNKKKESKQERKNERKKEQTTGSFS